MKIITWYLPQFHEIPENNEWWGEGFTEWVNVKKAQNWHPGQHLPNVPLNNNYYNLIDDNVKKWQVDLAKEYGVYGFAMYHYWFDGKLLLEKPVEQYLANKDLDLPFCICWANEHWTNRWVKEKEDILIEQRYGDAAQWTDHFNYLLPFMQDERYIRVNDKPLLIIYRPELIDCLNDMIDLWQDLAVKNGLGGLTMAYQGEKWDLLDSKDKDDSRFDLNIEFQPAKAFNIARHKKHKIASKIQSLIPKWAYKYFETLIYNAKEIFIRHADKGGVEHDFNDLWQSILNQTPNSEKSVPGAFVGWDNSPRKKANGTYVTGDDPLKFEEYVYRQIINARDKYKKDMIFMFAWNEWAEGGYLEPDERNGHANLQAIKNALIRAGEWPVSHSAKG